MATPECRVGPVQALAVVTKGFSETRHKHTDRRGYHPLVTETVVRGRECSATLVALRAGGVELSKVNPEVKLVIGTLKNATYTPDGAVTFQSQAGEEEREMVQTLLDPEASSVIVMAGYLARMRTASGLGSFEMQPFAWDLADTRYHAPDRAFNPTSGLVYGPGTLKAFFSTPEPAQ